MIILEIDLTWIIALCTLVPIFILLVVAFVIALVKRIKLASKFKKNKKGPVDEELKGILLKALGDNNIEDVEVEMSRLTITVKDIDLVDPQALKNTGANGVLLMGNKVKCSYGDKAEEISKLLK